MATEPAVELRGIVKTYGAAQALRGADLRLRPGSVHGLVGQNGAGKSTIIKILAGIEQADAGAIRVFGHAAALLSGASGVRHHRRSRMAAPSGRRPLPRRNH